MGTLQLPGVRTSGRLFLLTLLVPGLCGAQTAPPIHKDGLFGALEHKVDPDTIRRSVRDLGVDFALAPEDEVVLEGRGADPALIAAIRQSPRKRAAFSDEGDGPFTRMETILKLRGGAPAERLAKEAMYRGVNFRLTPDVERAISAAGGDDRLIGVLALRYRPVTDTLSEPAPAPAAEASRSMAQQGPVPSLPEAAARPPYHQPTPRVMVKPKLSPSFLAMLRAEVKVQVVVRLDAGGRVAQAVATARPGPLRKVLEQAALDAARVWRFEPGTFGDRPVISEHIVEFTFQPIAR